MKYKRHHLSSHNNHIYVKKVLEELGYNCIARKDDGHFYYVSFKGIEVSYQRLYDGILNEIT